MSAAEQRRGAADAVERLVNRGDDADETLRRVVRALHERVDDYVWVGIAFVETGGTVRGPASGPPPATPRTAVPILYDGRPIGELAVASVGGDIRDDDRAFLERVAKLISAHALVAWDTGGAAWEP